LNAKLPELAAGGDELARGAEQLGQGAEALASGLGELAEGTDRLYGGLGRLTDGAADLREGAGALAAGTAVLSGALAEAAERTATLHGDETFIALMAQPVAIRERHEREVTNYGSGIAPYFLSLAFFAGALIYSNTFPIRGSYTPNVYGLRLFVGKLLSYGLMGVAQALIVGTVVVYGLRMPVQSVPLFYLYTAIVSLSFMFLVQMLVTWLGRPGQFLALVLLILQLVGSAGTFPYELLPGWAQALHPWLPMSYSVIGYRDVISVGSYADMWTEAGKLLLILAAGIVLIGVFYWLQAKRIKGEGAEPAAPAPAPVPQP
jgi:putative membrane protein